MSRLEQWGRGRVPVLCSVLVKSIAHVKGSLQAVLGWPRARWGRTSRTGDPCTRRGSGGRQQLGVGKALEPPDIPRSPTAQFAECSSGGHAGTFQQLNSKCCPAQSLSNWGFCFGSTGPPEGLGGGCRLPSLM